MALFSRLPFDKHQIEQAIAQFEQLSSAELRVYIERKLPKSQPAVSSVERALQVFEQLAMTQTQGRNGVLIYIAYKDQQCSIIGDQGIHQYVGDAFWQAQCDLMVSYFKRQKYSLGVVSAIEKIGHELAIHFPIQPDDVDELPNEVIIHD